MHLAAALCLFSFEGEVQKAGFASKINYPSAEVAAFYQNSLQATEQKL